MLKDVDFMELRYQVGQVFTPNTPVSEKDMFSGRKDQISKVIEVIFQKGQHAIIFGDRGVGKTSLANVLYELIPRPTSLKNDLACIRINCDTQDDFASIWQKVFDEMQLIKHGLSVGFSPENVAEKVPIETFFPYEKIAPEQVRKALLSISTSFLPIIILDEFDRLNESIKILFADLIKTLSDHSLNSTVILIGVGENVEELIREHESVSRALVQINMPRMALSEIKEIIIKSLSKLEMAIENDTLNSIAILSKGLPHYAHLIGRHAAKQALEHNSLTINNEHFIIAIEKAINDAQHSIKIAYHNAIRSTKKKNLFMDVILACALAPVNELGEFAAQDLRESMLKITSKNYEIAAYARHLDEFSSVSRGNILIKSGMRKRFRYKFKDPLMQSFVIMQGILSNKIASPQ